MSNNIIAENDIDPPSSLEDKRVKNAAAQKDWVAKNKEHHQATRRAWRVRHRASLQAREKQRWAEEKARRTKEPARGKPLTEHTHHALQVLLSKLHLNPRGLEIVGYSRQATILSVQTTDPVSVLKQVQASIEKADVMCPELIKAYGDATEIKYVIKTALKRVEYDDKKEMLSFPHVVFNAGFVTWF